MRRLVDRGPLSYFDLIALCNLPSGLASRPIGDFAGQIRASSVSKPVTLSERNNRRAQLSHAVAICGFGAHPPRSTGLESDLSGGLQGESHGIDRRRLGLAAHVSAAAAGSALSDPEAALLNVNSCFSLTYTSPFLAIYLSVDVRLGRSTRSADPFSASPTPKTQPRLC